MRLLSPILQRVVYPALGTLGYFRARASAGVVTYHGVLPEHYPSTDSFLDNTLIGVDSFRSQLRLLKKHYNVISPDLFLRWVEGEEDLPERAILLTCDDGLLNNLTTMLPVLQSEGLKCLFFLTGTSAAATPGMLWYIELYLILMQARNHGEALEWRGIRLPAMADDLGQRRALWLQLLDRLSQLDSKARSEFLREAAQQWGLAASWKERYLEDPLLRQRFQLLCAEDVRALAEAGMTIGAHTMSHPTLSEQPAELAAEEIRECKQILRLCCGQPVWALAYPYGNAAAVGHREYELAQAAGYECAFLNVAGSLSRSCRFSLPRVHITAEMSLPVYEACVSGFHEILRGKFRKSNGKTPN